MSPTSRATDLRKLDEKSQSQCVICSGTPTVRSHLIPRALSRDMMKGEKHLVEGSLGRPGAKFTQSGFADERLLCSEHEAALGIYDNYGVRIARAIGKAVPAEGARFVTVENPRPHLFRKFVLSLIWRQVASSVLDGEANALGPYREKIEAAIFHDGDVTAPMFVTRPDIRLLGNKAPLIVHPARTVFLDRHAWRCELGGISVLMKLDRRPWPPELRRFDLGSESKAEVLVEPPKDLREIEAFRPLFKHMLTM